MTFQISCGGEVILIKLALSPLEDQDYDGLETSNSTLPEWYSHMQSR
jgi:hypothetical protein